MQKVVLDRPLQSELTGASYEVELCDDAGRTVGYFVPPEVHRKLYDWAFSLFDDPEELEAARRDPVGYTTAEAIARVEEIARNHQRKQP